MYKSLFWLMVAARRRAGRLLPARLVHWLARRGYSAEVPADGDFHWYTDSWGNRLRLHPHYFIDYHIIAFGTYEPKLGRFLERTVRPGMVVFDVGANIGAISVQLARQVGPRGAVHSFEPIKPLHARLSEHLEVNGFAAWSHAHCLALGNRTGVQEIALASPGFANQAMASLVDLDAEHLTERITIEVETLDHFVDRVGIKGIDFMKIDIQGAEPLLLEGGRDTLRRFRPVLAFEVGPEELAAGGSSSRMLLESIVELGYTLNELTEAGLKGTPVSPTSIPENYGADVLLATPKVAAD